VTNHGKKLFVSQVTARTGAGQWTERREVTKTGVLELVIDIDSIMRQIGEKALRSKGRQSKAMAGAIIGKVHSVEQVETRT